MNLPGKHLEEAVSSSNSACNSGNYFLGYVGGRQGGGDGGDGEGVGGEGTPPSQERETRFSDCLLGHG